MKKYSLLLLFLVMFQTIFSQNIVSDTIFHEVDRKETLFSISQKYNINVNDILELNPKLKNSRYSGSNSLNYSLNYFYRNRGQREYFWN